MKLTQEQISAVNHKSGHARIIAVAGAGKTATLIHYLKKRISAGANAKRILVLMYNRAAKEAFGQRFNLEDITQKPTIRTFHALGLKLYKLLITKGFLTNVNLTPPPSNVIDLQIKQLLQSSEQASDLLHSNDALQEWLEATNHFIQLSKCHLHGPKYTFDELDYPKENEFLIQIFYQFEDWRKSKGIITYDDMLFDPASIFKEHPDTQSLVRDILDEILVDEYQDINPIQHFLLKIISGKRARVIVIGDPDQTIYEFRGSSPSFINKTFSEDFNEPQKYSLSKTFRFGHELALAANHLIKNNQNRDPILTISAEGTPQTKIYLAETDNHGVKVAETIQTLHKKGATYSAIAILCRLWSFARPVELQLLAKGIPYCIEGEQSILQCWEVRPFMHLLSILSKDFFTLDHQKKSQYLFEILSTPSPKIPHKILHSVANEWAVIIESKNLHSSLKKVIPKDLSTYQYKSFKTIIEALKQLKSSKPCSIKFRQYAKTLDYQHKLLETALNPTKGIEQQGTVNAYLQFINTLGKKSATELYQCLSDMQLKPQTKAVNAITITTIHRSKGREWPAVFIPDVSEGHMPYLANNNTLSIETLESERRLMYVAMTRAQRKLFITTSKQDIENGKTGNRDEQAAQSRFIEEMQLENCQKLATALSLQAPSFTCSASTQVLTENYLKALNSSMSLTLDEPKPPTKNKQKQGIRKLHNLTSNLNLVVGDKVRHAILGSGEITKLESEKIRIHFDNGGTRTFISHLVEPHLSLEKESI